MVSRSLTVVVSVALIALTGHAAVPVATEDEVAFTVVAPDHGDASTDKIELYNPSAVPVDLEGGEILKFPPEHRFADTCSVPLEGALDPQGLLVVENPHSWSACSWSPSQGQLTLYNGTGTPVTSVAWGQPGSHHEQAIPEGEALERCFVLNPGPAPATEAHWLPREAPSLGAYNDPCPREEA